MKFIDLTNKRFGKLVAKERSGYKDGRITWLCICDCGNEKIVTSHNLMTGNTKSCGCINLEQIKLRSITHGHCKNNKISYTYIVWQNMKRRCNNIKDTVYKYYGRRGIKVCERWSNKKNGFQNFLKDVGEIPRGLTLDRINNDGNYEPNNWQLATMKEQNRNKRNNIMVPYDGKLLCLKDYCGKLNLPYKTIHMRIRRGYTLEEAITNPKRNRKVK